MLSPIPPSLGYWVTRRSRKPPCCGCWWRSLIVPAVSTRYPATSKSGVIASICSIPARSRLAVHANPGDDAEGAPDDLVPDRWAQPQRRLFTTGRGPIPPGEAARWLVTAHAADRMGIKSPAPGDPRAASGRVYPRTVGWAAQYAITYLVGATLAETVRLNCPSGVCGVDDLPAWERPVTSGRPRESGPAGLADLYTWQSRRVLLGVGDGREITGAIVAY